MAVKYDFSGWVTQYDIRCTDGRTIRNNAFAHMDGQRVPLVSNHVHDDPEKWLGFVDLEHHEGTGLYGRASLNGNPKAQAAKEAVAHGDVNSFSIYANHLKQNGGNVIHGDVKEVSLVLCGANSGAKIDFPVINHSGMVEWMDSDHTDYADDYEDARITFPMTIAHADEYDEESVQDVIDTMNDKQKAALAWCIQEAVDEAINDLAHADDDDYEDYDEGDDEMDEIYESMTPEQQEYLDTAIEAVFLGDVNIDDVEHADSDDEIYESMTPEQQEYLDAAIEAALDIVNGEDLDEVDDDEYDDYDEEDEYDEDEYENMEDGEDAAHSELYHSDEGDYAMKSNVFEARYNGGATTKIQLTNDDFAEIIKHAESSRDSLAAVFKGYVADNFLMHGDQDYGIKDIEILFPDAKLYENEPGLIKRKTEWVSKVLSGISKRPFSRIKTRHADITKDEARAKGYTKGNKKLEEVFELLQRVTTPTTVYKKQKIDRDDKLDITDFAVVNFIKKEMRLMLNEELARAILIGDGRTKLSPDKIKEDCIRPIVNDDDLYCIKAAYTYKTDADPDTDEANKARAFIKKVIKSRKEYRGSGSPDLFTTEDMITACLLLEDGVGRPLYDTEEKLRTKLRVSEIVTVPVMEGLVREDKEGNKYDVDAIMVNLTDYVGGADKGGEINTFEDFDIDYNQEKFLMETRMSGALVEPLSAIVFERKQSA